MTYHHITMVEYAYDSSSWFLPAHILSVFGLLKRILVHVITGVMEAPLGANKCPPGFGPMTLAECEAAKTFGSWSTVGTWVEWQKGCFTNNGGQTRYFGAPLNGGSANAAGKLICYGAAAPLPWHARLAHA